MLKLKEKFYRDTMLLIFIGLTIIVLLTFRHYGITWDEELQSQYGLAIVDYYASFFKDQRYAEIYNLYLYGGMFDGLASAIDRFTPFNVYETRHLVNAIFGLFGLWGTWRLGNFFGGGKVGLIALILLATTPMYYGHMFNNPKDIPFAAGIVWSMVYMAKSLTELPHVHRRTIIKLGIILGLSLGIRVGGVMALAFWLPVLAWNALAASAPRGGKILLRKIIPIVWSYGWRIVLPVGVIAYIVMLACWPWAQQSPILNPLRALNEFRNFPHDVEMLLHGTTYMSTALPRSYVPLYFAVQLPEFLLVLLTVGVVSLPWIWRDYDKYRREALALVLLMAFAPILYAVAAHPALYDAVRHFLFVVPLACVFASIAACRAFDFAVTSFDLPGSRRAIAAGLLIAAGIALTTQVGLMIALHPYEYIYANAFTGGVPGAFKHYELDYWGSSFKEAAQDLQAYVAREGGVPPGKIYRIAICGPWSAAMIYLPPDYEPVIANEPAEFFLSTTRWMCQNMRPGKEILRVSRLGVPLAVVKDLRTAP